MEEKKQTKEKKFKPFYFQSTQPMLQVTLCSRAFEVHDKLTAHPVLTRGHQRPHLVLFKIPICPQVLWILM